VADGDTHEEENADDSTPRPAADGGRTPRDDLVGTYDKYDPFLADFYRARGDPFLVEYYRNRRDKREAAGERSKLAAVIASLGYLAAALAAVRWKHLVPGWGLGFFLLMIPVFGLIYIVSHLSAMLFLWLNEVGEQYTGLIAVVGVLAGIVAAIAAVWAVA
jgi:hypothetical protein